MLQTICSSCELGLHDAHNEIIQAPPPGVMGGSSCRCRGECVDGRYVPAQFEYLSKMVRDKFKENHLPVPDNIVLGEE